MLVSAQTPEVKRAGIAALGAARRGRRARRTTRPRRWRAGAPPPIPGLVFVSAFDDDHVIAGNGGLLAREILAQLPDVQAIVVPVGGGGLAGGIGVEVVPRGIKLLGASPEANCAMRRSLDEGRAYTTYEGGPTLAEGLEGAVSERTFAMARDYFPDIALVSELADPRGDRLRVPHAGHHVRGVGGARAGRAARRRRARSAAAARSSSISGGNIEPDLLDQLLTGGAAVGV